MNGHRPTDNDEACDLIPPEMREAVEDMLQHERERKRLEAKRKHNPQRRKNLDRQVKRKRQNEQLGELAKNLLTLYGIYLLASVVVGLLICVIYLLIFGFPR